MVDLSDLRIRFEVSGMQNFTVESYYPESEFSIGTAADYSDFVDKIKGIGESLAGQGINQLSNLRESVNAGRSTFVGKRYWKPAYNTETFDKNQPFSTNLPFIFSTETGNTLDNIYKVCRLSQLTAPTATDSNTLILPGPHIGGLDEDVFNYGDNETSSLSAMGAKALSDTKAVSNMLLRSKDATRVYNTKVAFQVGNWFRIDEVIVRQVEAKLHPSIDRFNKRPTFIECDLSITSIFPPTSQDIARWYMIDTNKF